MKRLGVSLVLVAALAAPQVASAHRGSWYWSEARAERLLVLNYNDVYDADCEGLGRRYRGLYKHFECDAYLTEPDAEGYEIYEVVLHVRGKRRFSADLP